VVSASLTNAGTLGKRMEIVAQKVGFIGAGNMAQALIAGLLERGTLQPQQVAITDINAEQTTKVRERFAVTVAASAGALCQWADVIVLAIKPQVASSVLGEATSTLDENKLLVSICAGLSLATLGDKSGNRARLVRVMPNTPALVGEGATAFAVGPRATDADSVLVDALFAAVGQCVQVPESYLDAVTGLSGSGPAFVMLFIEALADGGVRAGLPRAVALRLATQTVLGSAKLVRDSEQHPGVLKDQVTSPAGTTIEGVACLERGGFRGLVMDAVSAAARRASELSKS
jgi:pyrroline-5-carboxylate reductase